MRREYLAETARTLDKNVKQSALGERPLDDVASEDIERLVRDIAKAAPSQANHTLAYFKAMLSWAVGEGLIERIRPPPSKCRRKRWSASARSAMRRFGRSGLLATRSVGHSVR